MNFSKLLAVCLTIIVIISLFLFQWSNLKILPFHLLSFLSFNLVRQISSMHHSI
jgi:uncharacterized membrane protein